MITAERTFLGDHTNHSRVCTSRSSDLSETSKEAAAQTVTSSSIDNTNNQNNNTSNQERSSSCDPKSNQSASDATRITKLVLDLCWKTNSCSIDLRKQATPLLPNSNNINNDNNYTTSNNNSNNISVPTTTTTLTKQQQMSLELGNLINEPCPSKRKLLEIVYRCRPTKIRKVSVCRGNDVSLSCPEKKRILVTWSEYGFDNKDLTKMRVCGSPNSSSSISNNQNLQQTSLLKIHNNNIGSNSRTSSSSTSINSNKAPWPNCFSNTSSIALINECHLKRQCTLNADSNLLGEPDCALNQQLELSPYYQFKYSYFCAPESIIVNSFLNETLVNEIKANATAKQRQQPGVGRGMIATTNHLANQHQNKPNHYQSVPTDQLSVSINYNNNKDNQSVYRTRAGSSINNNEQALGDSSGGNQPLQLDPTQSQLSPSLSATNRSTNSLISNNEEQPGEAESVIESGDKERDGSQYVSVKRVNGADQQQDIFKIVSTDSVFSHKTPSEWSKRDRVRFLLKQYSNEVIIISCFFASSIVLAVVVRFCRNSTNKSTSSSYSTSKQNKVPSSKGNSNSTRNANSNKENQAKKSIPTVASSGQLCYSSSSTGSCSPSGSSMSLSAAKGLHHQQQRTHQADGSATCDRKGSTCSQTLLRNNNNSNNNLLLLQHHHQKHTHYQHQHQHHHQQPQHSSSSFASIRPLKHTSSLGASSASSAASSSTTTAAASVALNAPSSVAATTQRQFNSCSESYFSLDDFQSAAAHLSSLNPATSSSSSSDPHHHHHQMEQSELLHLRGPVSAGACLPRDSMQLRPRLWTIYQNQHLNHSQNQQLSQQNGAHYQPLVLASSAGANHGRTFFPVAPPILNTFNHHNSLNHDQNVAAASSNNAHPQAGDNSGQTQHSNSGSSSNTTPIPVPIALQSLPIPHFNVHTNSSNSNNHSNSQTPTSNISNLLLTSNAITDSNMEAQLQEQLHYSAQPAHDANQTRSMTTMQNNALIINEPNLGNQQQQQQLFLVGSAQNFDSRDNVFQFHWTLSPLDYDA